MTGASSSFPVYAVDDHPQILSLVSIVCEDHGISCRTFPSGTQFIAELDKLEPGCVLLDMHMPGLSGLQVQEALAGRPAFVAFAMTGYGNVDVAVQTMRLGALEFLEEPFLPEVLIEALQQGFDALQKNLVAEDCQNF